MPSVVNEIGYIIGFRKSDCGFFLPIEIDDNETTLIALSPAASDDIPRRAKRHRHTDGGVKEGIKFCRYMGDGDYLALHCSIGQH